MQLFSDERALARGQGVPDGARMVRGPPAGDHGNDMQLRPARGLMKQVVAGLVGRLIAVKKRRGHSLWSYGSPCPSAFRGAIWLPIHSGSQEMRCQTAPAG